jgi:uncharacterized protein YuzE
MKKLALILFVSIFIGNYSFAQLFPETVAMKVGDQIEVKDLLNKKGKVIGVQYFQDGKLLNANNMCKTLKEVEAAAENMKKVYKLRTGRIIMTVVGLVTFPMGYLILVAPIISNIKKEQKYILLAVEDYNKSL